MSQQAPRAIEFLQFDGMQDTCDEGIVIPDKDGDAVIASECADRQLHPLIRIEVIAGADKADVMRIIKKVVARIDRRQTLAFAREEASL